MAYLDAYLQPCPGYGWSGGPVFNTQIVPLQSGRERRNAMWAEAKHSYASPFNNISKEAYRQVKQMSLVCRGQLHAFRFRDELDYEAENEVFAIGDGVKLVFQLAKISIIDGISYNRNVYAPVDPSLVTADNVVVTPTIDYRRGTVTFLTPPANGVVLRWTGDFDVWVRFNQDDLPFSLDNPNATNGVVNLVEVAPPDEDE